MAFRPRPASYYWSDRIDFDTVSERMLALRTRCAEATDIPAFMAVVKRDFQAIIASYLHIMDGDAYRQGEMASLLGHLEDCLNELMPSHLPYVALAEEQLRFIPKSHIRYRES